MMPGAMSPHLPNVLGSLAIGVPTLTGFTPRSTQVPPRFSLLDATRARQSHLFVRNESTVRTIPALPQSPQRARLCQN